MKERFANNAGSVFHLFGAVFITCGEMVLFADARVAGKPAS
jgi:hypothetical protein